MVPPGRCSTLRFGTSCELPLGAAPPRARVRPLEEARPQALAGGAAAESSLIANAYAADLDLAGAAPISALLAMRVFANPLVFAGAAALDPTAFGVTTLMAEAALAAAAEATRPPTPVERPGSDPGAAERWGDEPAAPAVAFSASSGSFSVGLSSRSLEEWRRWVQALSSSSL